MEMAGFAPTLLRLAMGVMFLAHGVLWKLIQTGPQHVIPWFVGHGYPAAFGWFVIAMESAGGVLLLLGWRTRIVALALAALMAGITWHQFPNGWIYTYPMGGWEYPAFWTLCLVVLAMLGPGRLALDGRRAA
jgi:putative oxidoreductase